MSEVDSDVESDVDDDLIFKELDELERAEESAAAVDDLSLIAAMIEPQLEAQAQTEPIAMAVDAVLQKEEEKEDKDEEDESSDEDSSDEDEVVVLPRHLQTDEESDAASSLPPRTKNELVETGAEFATVIGEGATLLSGSAGSSEEPLILEDDVLHRVGAVSSSMPLEGVVVVAGDTTDLPLVEGTLLCDANKVILGRVGELFGPVCAPFYIVRLGASVAAGTKAATDKGKAKNRAAAPEDKEPPSSAPASASAAGSDKFSKFPPQTAVFCVSRQAQFITPSTIATALKASRGSDASNMYDEELGDEQQEFSDDEKEKEAKKLRKKSKAVGVGGEAAGGAGAEAEEEEQDYSAIPSGWGVPGGRGQGRGRDRARGPGGEREQERGRGRGRGHHAVAPTYPAAHSMAFSAYQAQGLGLGQGQVQQWGQPPPPPPPPLPYAAAQGQAMPWAGFSFPTQQQQQQQPPPPPYPNPHATATGPVYNPSVPIHWVHDNLNRQSQNQGKR